MINKPFWRTLERTEAMRTNLWNFNPQNLTIHNDRYEVDLEQCGSSAAILDWIFQILHKCWATPDMMYELLQKLDHTLEPQRNFCSWGVEQKPDLDTVLTIACKRYGKVWRAPSMEEAVDEMAADIEDEK